MIRNNQFTIKVRMKFIVFTTISAITVRTGDTNSVIPNLVNTGLHRELTTASSYNCPTGYHQPANSNWASCYKVNSYLYSIAAQGATWLGIDCLNGDVNTCVNNDGTTFVYNNFYPGQPNVDATCVYMSTVGRDSQKWLSFGCEQKLQFACEAPALGTNETTTINMEPVTSAPTKQCPTGYSLFQGMCYMNAYSDGLTRDQEFEFCRRVPGGNLATIPNNYVNNFVQTLQCRNPYVRIGLKCPNVKFDGDTSSCVWDDGTPFRFNKFDRLFPEVNDNPCIYEYNTLWYNQSNNGCNANFACFLCEATPQ